MTENQRPIGRWFFGVPVRECVAENIGFAVE